MTNGTLHPGRTEPVIFFLILGVIILAAIAGKDIIAWILMKLHELFIQQNSARI